MLLLPMNKSIIISVRTILVVVVAVVAVMFNTIIPSRNITMVMNI